MVAVPSRGRASLVEAPRVAPEAAATQGLYERHAAKILSYCQHQLGSREEAEDAVQTTFMNAFRALGKGIVPENESAWLFKIAENVCLSRRRSSWRRNRIESPSDFEVIEEIVPGPSRQRDELIGIEDALASMPEQQRRAILLREWQGLSYREIADELELSQSAVETLIFRARRSLAQGLEQPETLKKAPRKSLRRALHAADLGTLIASLKTILTGAAAAKATVAAVAVTAAAGTAITVSPHSQPTPVKAPAPVRAALGPASAVAAKPAFAVSVSAGPSRRAAIAAAGVPAAESDPVASVKRPKTGASTLPSAAALQARGATRGHSESAKSDAPILAAAAVPQPVVEQPVPEPPPAPAPAPAAQQEQEKPKEIQESPAATKPEKPSDSAKSAESVATQKPEKREKTEKPQKQSTPAAQESRDGAKEKRKDRENDKGEDAARARDGSSQESNRPKGNGKKDEKPAEPTASVALAQNGNSNGPVKKDVKKDERDLRTPESAPVAPVTPAETAPPVIVAVPAPTVAAVPPAPASEPAPAPVNESKERRNGKSDGKGKNK